MKGKSTLLLAIIFIALLAYIYFYEIKGGEKRREAQEKAKKVLVFEKEDVQRIKITHSGKTIECQKEGDRWKIIHPVKTEADKWAVEGIVSSLQRAKIERVIDENPEDLRGYGLDPPQVKLEIRLKNGQADTIYLGDKNPTQTYVFAKLGGSNRVFTTYASLLNVSKKDLFDLRDKTVLNFKKEDVNKLILNCRGEKFVCSKIEDEWKLEKPIKVKADKSQINKILNKLKYAKAKEFVAEKPENLNKFGLGRPRIQIDLFLKPEGAKKSLWIGDKKDDNYYAKDESRDPVFLVGSDVVKELDKDLFDLRNKDVLTFKRDSVNQIILKYPDKIFTLEKDTSGTWMITQPKKAKAKSWKVNGILSSLSTLKVKKFVSDHPTDLAKYGLTKPQIEVILKQDQRGLAYLLIGKKQKDLTYAKSKSVPSVYLVNSSIIKDLTFKIEDLMEEK